MVGECEYDRECEWERELRHTFVDDEELLSFFEVRSRLRDDVGLLSTSASSTVMEGVARSGEGIN